MLSNPKKQVNAPFKEPEKSSSSLKLKGGNKAKGASSQVNPNEQIDYKLKFETLNTQYDDLLNTYKSLLSPESKYTTIASPVSFNHRSLLYRAQIAHLKRTIDILKNEKNVVEENMYGLKKELDLVINIMAAESRLSQSQCQCKCKCKQETKHKLSEKPVSSREKPIVLKKLESISRNIIRAEKSFSSLSIGTREAQSTLDLEAPPLVSLSNLDSLLVPLAFLMVEIFPVLKVQVLPTLNVVASDLFEKFQDIIQLILKIIQIFPSIDTGSLPAQGVPNTLNELAKVLIQTSNPTQISRAVRLLERVFSKCISQSALKDVEITNLMNELDKSTQQKLEFTMHLKGIVDQVTSQREKLAAVARIVVRELKTVLDDFEGLEWQEEKVELFLEVVNQRLKKSVAVLDGEIGE